MHIPFDNSYAKLPERFYARLPPTRVKSPQSIVTNDDLAISLGLDPDSLKSADAADLFAGNLVPEGADPLAMAYAGHQFGHFVPQLGDGRAILLGEIVDRNGVRQDIHLKGAGRTPFSRGGDGRAALGPVLREYIVSSHMHALGIPTTRALAAVTTGEDVYRETRLPGAVLTRIAASHLRVGTFQYFAVRHDTDALQILTDYALARHYPDAETAGPPALTLLQEVMRGQSRLVAKWLSVGFIHGVMNTDNTSIAGETIDYGPCAFVDTYSPDKVFSSIDHAGRYAFMNQPTVLQWNMAQFAQALLPLIDADAEKAVTLAQGVIDTFPDVFAEDLRIEFAKKLGLDTGNSNALDMALSLLEIMADQRADFTLTFRHLASTLENAAPFRAQFEDPAAVDDWLGAWRAQVMTDNSAEDAVRQKLLSANPAVVARNHLVERVIRAAEDRSDYTPLADLLAVVTDPFSDPSSGTDFAAAPAPQEVVHQTFCGT